MQTHKTTVTIDEKHQIVLRLPPDFPAGEADVIVSSDHTAEGPAAERLRALDELMTQTDDGWPRGQGPSDPDTRST